MYNSLTPTAGRLVCILAGALLFAPPAYGQVREREPEPPARDCTLRYEPGGMIRGDRIPSGCALRAGHPHHDPLRMHGYRKRHVITAGTIFFSPRPTILLLEHPVGFGRIDRDGRAGRAVLPPPRTVPTRRASHFGPLFRHFGPLFRHFGPVGATDRFQRRR